MGAPSPDDFLTSSSSKWGWGVGKASLPETTGFDWRKNAPFSTWGGGSRQLSCGWSRKNKTQTNPPSCRRARSTLVPGILAAGGGDNHRQRGGCAAPGRDPAESLPFGLCDKERQGRGRRRTHTHTHTHTHTPRSREEEEDTHTHHRARLKPLHSQDNSELPNTPPPA